MGVLEMSRHPQILADKLTLSQPRGGGADYAHHITTGTRGFPDLPTAVATLIETYRRAATGSKATKAWPLARFQE